MSRTAPSESGPDGAASTPLGTAVDEQDPGVRHRRRNVGILAVAIGLDSNENGLINILFPVMQVALGLPIAALGILTAASRLSGVVAAPIGATLARRYGRKRVLVIALGAWGVWGILAGLSQSFWQILVLWTVMAAGIAVGTSLAPAVIGDSYPEQRRGRAVGWLLGLSSLIGVFLAPATAQFAGIPDGWRYGFFIAGGISLLVGVLILALYRDPATGSADPALATIDAAQRAPQRLTLAQTAALLRVPSFSSLLVVRLLGGMAVLPLFGVLLLTQGYGLPVQVAGVALVPFGLGFLVSNVVAGYIGDAVDRRSPRHGRVTLVQAAQFVFAAFILVLLAVGGGQNLGVVLILFAVLGIATGFDTGPSRPIVMTVVQPGLRQAALTLLFAVETAGIMIIAILAGVLSDAIGVPAMIFWTSCVLVAVKGFILIPAQMHYGRDRRRALEETQEERAEILADGGTRGAGA